MSNVANTGRPDILEMPGAAGLIKINLRFGLYFLAV